MILPSVQRLRALAIALVVSVHIFFLVGGAVAPGPWRIYLMATEAGRAGVDLFFVISGFVITRELLSGGLTLGEFYARRIWRIWPALFVWLAIVWALSVLFNASGTFQTPGGNAQDALAAVTQTFNVYFLHCIGREVGACGGVNDPLWSLSLEFQFYIVLPLIVMASRRGAAWVAAALIAGLFFVARPAWTMGWVLRVDGFCWGVLLAYAATVKYSLTVRLKALAWPLAALLLGVGLVFVAHGPEAVRIGMTALCFAGVVALAVADPDAFRLPERVDRAVLWVGDRSFSLYLAHVTAFKLVREVAWRLFGPTLPQWSWPILLVVGLPLALGLAHLSYRLVEQPARAYGRELLRKPSMASMSPGPRVGAARQPSPSATKSPGLGS